MLAPDLASARGGSHGGGGGGGGGRGGSGGIGGSSFGAAKVGGSSFQSSGSFGNSFARSTAAGTAGVSTNRFATTSGFRHDRDGFRHRRFFVGGFFGPDDFYDDYYDYPYYDNGCYIVQQRVHTRHGWRLLPVQVCG